MGDEIEILESFKSNSKSKVILKKGKIFVIKYVDESGDITVNDGSFKKNQWVRNKNFHKIVKLDPRPQNQVSIAHFKSCVCFVHEPKYCHCKIRFFRKFLFQEFLCSKI